MVQPIQIIGHHHQNKHPKQSHAISEQYSENRAGAQNNYSANTKTCLYTENMSGEILQADFEKQLVTLIPEEAGHVSQIIKNDARSLNHEDPVIKSAATSSTNSSEELTNSNEDITQPVRAPYTNDELRQFYKDLLKPNSSMGQDNRIAQLGFTSEELDRMNHICDVMDRFWKVMGGKRVTLGKRKR